MGKRAKRWGLTLALAVALSIGFAGAVRAQEDDQDLLSKFRQGVTCYETGEYARAKQAFSEVLAMNPGMQAALRMRDEAELQQFVQMRDIPEIAAEADQLLKLMMRAVRQGKRDVSGIGPVLADFTSGDLVAYGKARTELKGHGPYVVPHLIGLLAKEAPEDQVTVGRTVSLLASLHPDAVLPLCQALLGTEDSLVRMRLAGVLGQIGDERAVPALTQVWADPNSLPNVRQAAAAALAAITGQQVTAPAAVADTYLDLARAYLFEDEARVGFTYGMSADVWMWNAAGEDWADKLGYEEVPAYLYYQRMAADTALAGLAADPANTRLQSVLAAALVRQLALCEFFKTAQMQFGGEAVTDAVRAEAAERAAKLELQVPMVLSLLPTPQVAGALKLTLQAPDGPASLYLVKALDRKLEASGGEVPDQTTIDALSAALESGDKDVRYNAGVTLVKASPTGEAGAPGQISAVMSAAVRAATQRTALIIMRDFQTMNTLISVVRGAGVSTAETRPDQHLIDYTLTLQPSVDIVFVTGNVSDGIMARIMEQLQSDPRTKAAPIYAVVDPTREAADLSPYEAIRKVLTPDHLRASVIGPILQEEVLAESRSAFTDEEEALVLKAVQALAGVDPRTTAYDFAVIEPGLVQAVSGYSDEVTAAVVDTLRKFGSAAALPALAGVVAGDKTVDLKIAACRAIAAVLKRTEGPAPEDLVATLKSTLASDDQALRQAGAEALSVAGLSAEERLELVHSEALGE